jgi:hypothetical protein
LAAYPKTGIANPTQRRPLDDSMILRMVVVSGLVSGTDVARFYARQSAVQGTQSLEEYLQELGIDRVRLEAVRRAYLQTEQFGSLLLRYLRTHGADQTGLRAASRALNACETAQLMAIKKGKAAKPIGEMMRELGHVDERGLQAILRKQALPAMLEELEAVIRQESSLAGRLGLDRFRAALRTHRRLVALLVAALLLTAGFNLWYLGILDGAPGERQTLFGGSFDPRDAEGNARIIAQHYRNMMIELRNGSPGNAQHYRGNISKCFRLLEEADAVPRDAEVDHIRKTCDRLDFARLKHLPASRLPTMTRTELEKELSR